MLVSEGGNHMKNKSRSKIDKTVACAVSISIAIFAMLFCETRAPARLSANRLSANRLSPFSAAANSVAASRLAGSRLSIRDLGANRYAANAESTSDFVATNEGREIMSFILSCALPEGTTLVATLPDNSTVEFFGELGLADEWLDHPLKKAGRGWVSACLFARVNNNDVPLPISMRGQHQSLAAPPDEVAAWSLEEGAFYGDYFVAPGEPVQWVACRGKDQAVEEIAGLIDRDCTEPDPLHPGKTLCGFTYAGDCGDFSVVHACERFSPQGYYRDCHDQPGDETKSDVFRQVITVFVLQ